MREIIKYDIESISETYRGCSKNMIILLCLENEMKISVKENVSLLNTNDFILINPKYHYELSSQNAIYAQFNISMKDFHSIFPHKHYQFECNSTHGENDNYEILRKYLTDLLLLQYEEHEYRIAEQNKLTYELLLFIVNNFVLMDFHLDNDSRCENITEYIDLHYEEELSLKEISEVFGMNSEYFSRYFKKEMGINYYQYLNKIRLEHAVEDLIYTDKNMLHVALDNGFPNVEAFYRQFSKEFHMLPKELRQEKKSQKINKEKNYREALSKTVSQLYQLQKNTIVSTDMVIDVLQQQTYYPFWSEVINLNEASILSVYAGKEQFSLLHETLQFRYVRIYLHWKNYHDNKLYSFYSEENEFDFLVQKKMRIWFVIDYRQIDDLGKMIDYLNKLLSHFANRYSISNIKSWRFELVYNTIFNEEKLEKYMKTSQAIQNILDKFEVDEKVLGPGIVLSDHQSMKCFETFANKMHLTPLGMTFQGEPYLINQTYDDITIQRNTDKYFLKNQLSYIYKHTNEMTKNKSRIFITNSSDTIMRFNMMNDSLYRGAEIIKIVIDCFGYVNALAHSVPLDIAYTDKLQGTVLFGGDGLLTKHGIPKPSYYAYHFMRHVGEYFVQKSEYGIVFTNGHHNYQIVCHNCKRLSYHYYLEEDNLKYEAYDNYFDDTEEVKLNFHLQNLKNGRYVVKTRSVNRNHGSVQDELNRMMPNDQMYIHENDIDYLQQVAVPQVRIRTYIVKDGQLDLDIVLEANEFAYMHIIYQY